MVNDKMIKKGQEIELMGGGTITVAKSKETDNGLIVVSTEGEIYTEDELNLRYRLAPELILWKVLHKFDIDMDEYDHDLYKQVLEEFMADMEKAGYIAKGEEEE